MSFLSNMKDRIKSEPIYAFHFGWVYGGIILIFCSSIISFLALAQQALSWLKYSYIPSRDLYWLFSDARCEATGW